MADLIKAISSKPDWAKKIARESLVKKWAEELGPQGYSPEHLQVVIKLLKLMSEKKRDMDEYVNVFSWKIFCNDCQCQCVVCGGSSLTGKDPNDPNLLTPDTFFCKCAMVVMQKRQAFLEELVVKIPHLINDDTRDRLIQEVGSLESQTPDWHPDTNEQVLDLVHPSLFCYTDGVTKVLSAEKRCNKEYATPNVLQWLPAEVTVANGQARFASEINNLPRAQHLSFYFLLEDILSKFLPHISTCMEKHLDKPPTDLKNLQVVVKMANTVLTPEKPEFPGGNWHLEGHASEHIVATGIYYYQNDNIVDSGLYTRIPLKEEDEQDLNYGQNEFGGMPVHYLLQPEAEQPGIQHLGPVQTNEHDCLIFPNFVQHKVSTFRLADPTKPGVRKLLLFWVVDPNVKILSTADVESPQQSCNLRDAKLYREMLMYQRKNEVDERDKLYETELSLCEH